MERLRARVKRESDFLHRLVERMVDQRWNTNDPLWKNANHAAHAVDALLRSCAVTRRRAGGCRERAARAQPHAAVATRNAIETTA